MPYIEKEQREHIDGHTPYRLGMEGLDSFLNTMDHLCEDHCKGKEDWPCKPGTLNYIITRMVIWYLGKNPNYERYNAAIGVLECAKQEFYRRQIALYEDEKCRINGDVYPGQDKRDPSA